MVRIGFIFPLVSAVIAFSAPGDFAFAQTVDRTAGSERAASSSPAKGAATERAPAADRSAGVRAEKRFAEGDRDSSARAINSSASAWGPDKAKVRKSRDRECRRSLNPPERWQDGQHTYETRCDYRPYR